MDSESKQRERLRVEHSCIPKSVTVCGQASWKMGVWEGWSVRGKSDDVEATFRVLF